MTRVFGALGLDTYIYMVIDAYPYINVYTYMYVGITSIELIVLLALFPCTAPTAIGMSGHFAWSSLRPCSLVQLQRLLV